MKKITTMIIGLALSVVAVMFAGCGGDDNFTYFPITRISIAPATLPDGTVNVAYSQTLTATGGTAPYTWSISAGTLPAGLTLAPATGFISGTPTAAGTANFTVTVSDSATSPRSASRAYTLIIQPTPVLTITTTTLPAATVGLAYSQTLAASGGTTPYSWSVPPGTLPAGLSLDAATGVISGTPTTAGTSNFTVTVTDSSVPPATDTQALSIVVSAPGSPLTITTTTLPDATFNSAYAPQTLGATGGTPPYSWLISVGGLPTGLTMTGAGVISGTPIPIVAGPYNFTVMVTDSAVPQNTATQALTLTVTVPAAIQPGKTIYDNQCMGCHSLGVYDPSGSPDVGIMTQANFDAAFGVGGGGNHNGQTLSAAQIADVLAFTTLF